MAFDRSLLIPICISACALVLPARADLNVALPGDAGGASRPQKPAAKTVAKSDASDPVGLFRQTPAPSRGTLPLRQGTQIGVVRRGGAPVLPPVGVQEPPPPVALNQPQGEEMKVSARLGRTLALGTDVYRSPDPRSQWVARLPQGQQLAIASQWNGWFAIIMADGSQAYIPSTHVELLPYEVLTVTRVRPQPSPQPVASPDSSAGNRTPVLPPVNGAMGAAAIPAGASPLVRGLIQAAFEYLDTPYVYGGNGREGIDCSGLVKNCFASLGLALPRRASEQAQIGLPVALDQLAPGDRLYFSVKKDSDHTGIYLGNGYFIHAALSRGKVTVDHLSTPLYGKHLTAARRL
jgi:cell wall-associated NlpC family hydrolase